MKDDIVLGILGILAVISLIFFITLSVEESKKWELFKVEHNCKIVAHIDGSMHTGIAPIMGGNGGVGIVISSTPSKDGWLCDDGITYYK